MKRSTFFSIIFAIVIAIVALFAACDENTKKQLDLEEPQRTVVLMDYNGDTIRTWKGNFFIHACDGSVYFYVDGKKTIVDGGIIVSEEN